MKTLVVSTVGTSSLTNGASREEISLLRNAANLSATSDSLHYILDRQRSALLSASVSEAKALSAELNGIVSYYGGDLEKAKGDHHILLTTDTFQCRAAGEAISDWLRSKGISAASQTLEELATNDLDAFRNGIARLIQFCEEEVSGYRRDGYRVVFNLVGGFKAVQAYAQSLGMIYADDQIYLFEAEGSPLLHVPRLPVTFDLEGVVNSHFGTIRRLALQLPVAAEEVRAVPETLLELFGDIPSLSLWGQVAWQRHSRDAYARELLPSPDSRVVFGEGFASSCKKLESDRFTRLNESIDQLAQFQVSNGKRNPPSINVKSLGGKPVPGATHEADAWSDGAAWRLFLRFEGDKLVVVKLGPHL